MLAYSNNTNINLFKTHLNKKCCFIEIYLNEYTINNKIEMDETLYNFINIQTLQIKT